MGHVLVVDDEPQVRGMLDKLLTRAGHAVALAEEGAQALRLLDQSDFDIIILDLLMPGMEGLETLMRLKKAHPALKVIVISGGSRSVHMDFLPTALKLGADRALKKPFENDALLAAVDELLSD